MHERADGAAVASDEVLRRTRQDNGRASDCIRQRPTKRSALIRPRATRAGKTVRAKPAVDDDPLTSFALARVRAQRVAALASALRRWPRAGACSVGASASVAIIVAIPPHAFEVAATARAVELRSHQRAAKERDTLDRRRAAVRACPRITHWRLRSPRALRDRPQRHGPRTHPAPRG